ncbi:MAG: glycerol dehydrogenase [Oscillospiraceae bacterium]|nr:glycerol dehydrogenase [Oscillospiraceae bacterium]
MVKTFAAPSKYVQGRNILEHIEDYVGFLGDKFLVVTDDFVYGMTKDKLAHGFQKCAYEVEIFHGECTAEEGKRVAQVALDKGCCGLIGLGGGKAIDTAKYAANETGLAVVIVPTSAASDAPCTAMSVVYDDNGTFVVSIRTRHNPNVVLVDTQIIAESPVRHLLAGIGDAFSTYYEARAVAASGADNFSGGKHNEAAFALTELCNRLLLQYGAEAVQCVSRKEYSDAVEKIAEANIFLSGVGVENSGCALAHATYSGMTATYVPFPVMHGEGVAYGVLVQLAAEYAHAGEVNRAEWKEVTDFYRAVGLPMKLEDLGLAADEQTLQKLAAATCTFPNTKKMPFTVTPEFLFTVLKKLQNDEI